MTVLRETTEVVRHARAFTKRLPTAAAVKGNVRRWLGLRGREIRDFDPSIYWSPGKIAAASWRITTGEWTVVQLNTDWSQIVADLGCPVLAGGGKRGMAPRFISI